MLNVSVSKMSPSGQNVTEEPVRWVGSPLRSGPGTERA